MHTDFGAEQASAQFKWDHWMVALRAMGLNDVSLVLIWVHRCSSLVSTEWKRLRQPVLRYQRERLISLAPKEWFLDRVAMRKAGRHFCCAVALAVLAASVFEASAITASPSTVPSQRADYLNPDTGRFWTADSFEGNQSDPLSLHKYLYAQASPLNGTDYSGHFFDSISTLSSVASQFSTQTRNTATVQAGRVVARTSIKAIMESAAVTAALLLPIIDVGEMQEDKTTDIYRGVPREREHDYNLAVMGIAKPRGTRLDLYALEEHIKNHPIASGVTSWTTKRDVARTFSEFDGIILEIDFLSVRDRIVPRPPINEHSDEHEILLKGIIQARPTLP